MIKRRSLLALPGAIVVAGALPGCGGGGSKNGDGTVRLVNATGFASIDLRVSNNNLITAVAKGVASSYTAVGEGTTAFQVGVNGDTTTKLTQSATVAKDTAYTMVAYTTNNSTNAAFFADTEATPTTGTTKIRLFNASSEAGSLDLYVVTPGQAITGATPVNATVTGQRIGSYAQVPATASRVVVTGAGDPTDVRLDIASVTLTAQQIVTLVATSTAGGLLVDGLMIVQAGAVTAFGGTTVRLRLVTSLTSNQPVTVALNGTNVFSAIGSPSVENYVSVNANLASLTVNGATPTGVNLAPAAGSDLTLLVYGDPAAPTVKLLTDDNTLPSSSTKAKIRLVNGLNAQTEAISMTADFTQVASSIVLGAASAPAQVTPTSTMDLVVSTPSNAAVATLTDVNLTANQVFTVFMLESTGTPRAVLRRDR